MSCLFDTLRLHHRNTKAIVLHFIEQSKQLLPDKNIPAIVAAITVLYYQHYEYFTAYGVFLRPTHRINISTVEPYGSYTKHTMNYNTVYGNVRINNTDNITLYRWKFRVIRELYPRGAFGIGIDSSCKQFVGCVYYDKRYNPNPCYSVQFAESDASKFSQNETNIKYAECKYKEITIITMELNVKDKTMQFYFDGEDQGIAFNAMDFANNRQYFMALILNNTVIELIDFYQQ